MRRISPLVLFDLVGVFLVILLTILLVGTPLRLPMGIIVYAIAVFILIRLGLSGLVRIAESTLSDGLKLCWVLLILLLPILGSISCLIIIDKRQ